MNTYFNITSPAKLNLNLFVGDKISKGLHFLESDICFLELVDKIYVKFSCKDVFHQNHSSSYIINSKDNLILNAIEKFRSFTGWNKKFEVYLDKKIPIGAGLGGGSANAAATLILMRNLFNKEKTNNKISISKIIEIGTELGSDVPACLISKDIKLKGYGKEITRNKIPTNYYFIIVNPNVELSTKDVFENYTNFENVKYKTEKIFFEKIRIYNSLLSPATSLVPEISNIINKLKKIPNIVAYGMTGSGSTCFGIIKNNINISDLKMYFNKKYFFWYGRKANYNLNRVCCSNMLEFKF